MLIYLFFLLVLGLPIMVMEFAVGRASQASVALSFDKLEPKGTKWALVQVLWYGGKLSADDVLYHHWRMDAFISV